MTTLINLVLIIMFLILTIIESKETDNNKNNLEERKKAFKNKTNMKTLKPNIYSNKYDDKTVALEFNEDCLNGEDPEEKLQLLLTKYPCLTNKEVYENEDNTIFRHHDNIYRTYLSIISEENIENCLNNNILIDWNYYCINDISYDMILYLESVCVDDITNSIYYGTIKKPIAWSIDMLDNSLIDNKYKRPNLGNIGNDNGIDIWILDSGIYSSHNEFYKGQIIDEVTTLTHTSKHGTNAASVAGGNNYGSSKGFYIHDYIVCRNADGGCSFSDIDKGLQAVLLHMQKTGRRSVINMSVGSSGANNYISTQSYYDKLFQSITNAGGIIVVSAGNGNQDACNWWFSYSQHVISVGAHDKNKIRSTFSNYGPCVDIYAPGTSVPAANSITDPTSIGYVSGTSFSSPMVAGLVANLLFEDRTRTKTQIVSLLQSTTSRYSISNCASGYCYGFYYKCSILSANGIEDDENEDNEGNENEEDNKNINKEESNLGCCKPIRDLTRLNNYCNQLSLNECLESHNINYCFVDTVC